MIKPDSNSYTENETLEHNGTLSNGLLHSIIQFSPCATAVFDTDMICIACNDRFLRHYKLPRKGTVGLSHYETFPHLPCHLREVHQRVLRGSIESEDYSFFELEDGSTFYSCWECRPWYNEQGKIGGLILYIQALSDDQQAKFILREEKKRAEQDKKKLETVLANVNSGILAIDMKGTLIHANDAMARILGYSNKTEIPDQEALAISSMQFFSYPERIELPVNEWPLRRLYRNKTLQNMKCILHRLNTGTERIIEHYGSIIESERGFPELALLIATDITEQEQMMRELERSEKLYRTLLEVSPLGMFVIRLSDAKILNINSATCKMHGYTREEMLRLQPPDYIAEASLEGSDFFEFHKAMVEGRDYSIITQDRRKDGSEFAVEVFATPIVYQGEPCSLAMVTDITDRLQAEEELRKTKEMAEQQQAQLEAILGHISNGVAVFDTTGKQIYANEAQLKIFDIEDIDEETIDWKFIADHFSVRTHPDGKDLNSDEWPAPRVLADNKVNGELFQICRKDTDFERVVMMSGTPVHNAQGEVTFAVIASIDITERIEREKQDKILQKNMEQTQRLESLGVLAGGIAHDFNNLLMAIIGHADLALLELPLHSPVTEDIESIKSSSHRAADLCTQLLAYSGKGKVEESTYSITMLVQEMIQMLKTCISKTCILNLNLDPDLPLTQGDSSQMRQIIMNFVLNAAEAMDGFDGTITISTGIQNCSLADFKTGYVVQPEKPGQYVWMEVSDTGTGMDKETLNRIFEPFFTTKFSGRGLGLSAVLGIIRAHNGGLRVHSTSGAGTTFRVYLPAEETAPYAEMKPNEPSQLHNWEGKCRILLVDDEESVRNISDRHLRTLGIETLIAGNGKEAIELYSRFGKNIDLVILDLTMPQMSGEATFYELKKINPAVKVILASGYNESDIAPRFSEGEIAGYLRKPYTIQTLDTALAPLLKDH